MRYTVCGIESSHLFKKRLANYEKEIRLMELCDTLRLYKITPNTSLTFLEWNAFKRKLEKEIFILNGDIVRNRRTKAKGIIVSSQSNLKQDDERQENLIIQDSTQKISNNFNDISHLTGLNSLSLDDFFKRPVLIDSFVFGTGSGRIFRPIKPYELWSADATVRAKLKTYAYFRGDLKVRVVITTTAYQYGTMILSNQPHAEANPVLQSLVNSGGTDAAYERLLSYLSQSPEKAMIEYGNKQTYELLLPFISPKPVVRLYNRGSGVINNSVNYEEMGALSTFYMAEFNPLLATGVDEFDSDVSVEVYAYCDNVKLSVATATDLDITAQSGLRQEMPEEVSKAKNYLNDKVNNNSTLKSISDVVKKVVPDEYADSGPISTVASAVSSVANNLSSVPVIGDYAKATSFVAGRVAKVAKFFGFARPTQIKDIEFRKNQAFAPSYGAGADTSYKLTTDPKQELALTPFGGEMPQDPMAYNFITSREAFIGRLRWGIDQLPRDTVIGSFPIDPFTSNLSTSAGVVHSLTPMALVALYHEYWRGTVSFRIEVIASRFSKGKLLILYEPNNDQIADINAAPSLLNQQMAYYMDLDDERTKTIDCGFIFDRAFARTRDLDFTGGVDPITAANDTNATGTLTIKALTRLTGVDGTKNASINVYAYSNDMQFAFPRNINSSTLSMNVETTITPVTINPVFSQSNLRFEESNGANYLCDKFAKIFVKKNKNVRFSSEVIIADLQSDLRVTNPDRRDGPNITSGDRVDINLAAKMDPNAYLYYFGEQLTSFRQLFKKNFSASQGVADTAPDEAITLPVNIYPEFTRNMVPSIAVSTPIGLDIRSSTNGFNILRAAYLFMKGGMRHRFIVDSSSLEGGSATVSAVRTTDYDATNPGNFLKRISPAGSAIFHRRTNEGIDFEIPYYSSNLFEPTYGQLGFGDLGDSEIHYENSQILALLNLGTFSGFNYTNLAALAEDFTFFRFQGAPFLCENRTPVALRRNIS